MSASELIEEIEAMFIVPEILKRARSWHLLRLLPCGVLAVVAIIGGMLLGGAFVAKES